VFVYYLMILLFDKQKNHPHRLPFTWEEKQTFKMKRKRFQSHSIGSLTTVIVSILLSLCNFRFFKKY
jgi:hypothetical protein